MQKKNDIDWIGKWYEIAEERGVNITASLGQVDLKNKEVDWYDFSHAEMDGIGGLIKRLRELGFKIDKAPTGREVKAPFFIKRPLIFLKGLANLKKRSIHWKERTDTVKDPIHDFPWISFSIEETERIKDKAKNEKVSINALMLSVLNKILLSELLAHEQIGGWLFPVNMRGPIRKENELANQSSGVAIDLDQHSTAQEIHLKIKDELVKKSHWSNWWAYHIAKYVSIKKMRKISLNSAQTSFWFGTFSNMGEWPLVGTDQRENVDTANEAWLCTPPGTRNYPLSVGVITWYGKLSMTLKVHSSICSERTRVPVFLDLFRQKILS